MSREKLRVIAALGQGEHGAEGRILLDADENFIPQRLCERNGLDDEKPVDGRPPVAREMGEHLFPHVMEHKPDEQRIEVIDALHAAVFGLVREIRTHNLDDGLPAEPLEQRVIHLMDFAHIREAGRGQAQRLQDRVHFELVEHAAPL